MYGTRDMTAVGRRSTSCTERDVARINRRHVRNAGSVRQPRNKRCVGGAEESRELGLHGIANAGTVSSVKANECKLVDYEFDSHQIAPPPHPRNSPLLIGRSSFAYSARAACAR
jgi:hypothetical protein